MRRDLILKLLADHQEELASFGMRRLAIFGSVARDVAGPDSDVDILVEFSGEASFDRYIELSFFLEALLKCPVDLVTLPSLREYMRESILKDAVDVPQISTVFK